MKLLCWVMGIIMFLVIFFYDAKRVDKTIELERKLYGLQGEIRALDLQQSDIKTQIIAVREDLGKYQVKKLPKSKYKKFKR